MAERLFQGVLNRKVKADASRNALAVLQRYRFLFNLPRSIERNIRNVSMWYQQTCDRSNHWLSEPFVLPYAEGVRDSDK